MEQVIKKFVDWCFADGTVKWIAWRVLRSMENGAKNDKNSLQILALKAIVEKKMKKNIQGKLLFSLVFRESESIKITKFMDRYPPCAFREKLERAIFDKLTGYKRKREIYVELRKDPYIMFTVCEQLMDRKKIVQLDLIMTKTDLIIIYAHTILTIIPNRDNREHDTFWATKFFQLCLQKHRSVWLLAEGEAFHQWAEMSAIVYSVIDSVFPKRVPERGWANELAKGDRTVYKKDGDTMQNNRLTSRFYVVKEYDYRHASLYWSSLVESASSSSD